MTTLPADLERVLAEASECRNPGAAANLLATWLRNNLLDVREALVDAERYRWLRNEAWSCDKSRKKGSPHIGTFDTIRSFTELAEEALDAAVDAARAQEAGQ